MTAPLFYGGLAFAGSLFASLALYRVLSARQVLDLPNERSSHHRPTPKGGGIGFIAVICALLTGFIGREPLFVPLIVLGLATLAVSVLGLADDLRELGAGKRLIIQLLVALVFVALVFYSSSAFSTGGLLALWVPALLFLLWCTNLYNFMDGIDGLAAVQAILAGGLVFTLNAAGLFPGALGEAGLLLALGTLGFLVFNFPPAGMFMGDAGSGALGFLIAGLAVMEFFVAPDAFWLWVIALAGFISDATATLLVRLFTGQKFYQAHRRHLYQLWTRWRESNLLDRGWDRERARTRAHRLYLLWFTAVFLLWQVPWALLVAGGRFSGPAAALLCLLPLFAGAVAGGAGRQNRLTSDV